MTDRGPCGQDPSSMVMVTTLTACVVSFPLWWASVSYAQAVHAGTAENVIGTVVIIRPDGIQERMQGKGAIKLYDGDVVKTEAGSQALLQFKEGVQVAMNEDTQFKVLSRWVKDKATIRIVRLKQGEIWAKTVGGEGPRAFEVETPVATAAIRETEFDLKVTPDGQSVLTVITGIVEFGTPFGTCPIKPSTISYGNRGKKCTKPAPTDVKPAIAWLAGLLPLQTPAP